MIDWTQVAKAAIVAGFGLVSVLAGVPVVRGMLRLVDKTQAHREGLPGWDPRPDAPAGGVSASVRRLGGGAWIGMLERLAVFAALLAGFPTGIAIVLGIKGLARYPELQNPDLGAAQGFIIGTFMSVLFACACAGLAIWTIGLF